MSGEGFAVGSLRIERSFERTKPPHRLVVTFFGGGQHQMSDGDLFERFPYETPRVATPPYFPQAILRVAQVAGISVGVVTQGSRVHRRAKGAVSNESTFFGLQFGSKERATVKRPATFPVDPNQRQAADRTTHTRRIEKARCFRRVDRIASAPANQSVTARVFARKIIDQLGNQPRDRRQIHPRKMEASHKIANILGTYVPSPYFQSNHAGESTDVTWRELCDDAELRETMDRSVEGSVDRVVAACAPMEEDGTVGVRVTDVDRPRFLLHFYVPADVVREAARASEKSRSESR